MAEDHDDPTSNRPERASDRPPDWVRQREEFVRTFFRRGVEFTEDLLRENAELRQDLARLRDDNTRLRAQVASDDAIRDLLRLVERLEVEKRDLLARSSALEKNQRADEDRYGRIEQELNDLANLYIASHQLHSQLSLRRVIRHLCDMLGQLVGADSFAVYVVDPEVQRAMPIASGGLDESTLGPIPVGEGVIGDACLTGIARIRELESSRPGTVDDPMAVVPIMADGKAVGAIAVHTLLAQKDGWAPVDRELFKLIGEQAGTALIAANLYARTSGLSEALVGLHRKL